MTIDKGHKFKTLDFIKLVFLCTPAITIFEWICTAIFSLLPAIQTVATKNFIDCAVGVYKNKMTVSSIIVPLLLILFVICAQQINSFAIYAIQQKQKKELSLNINPMIVTKRSKLKYKYVENNDVWDLIDRTCSNTVDEMHNYYSNIVFFIQNILQIISLLIVIISYVWWIGIVLLILCIPIVFVAFKAGKEDYSAFERSEKIERKASYLHDTLMNRDNVAERSLFRYKDFLQKKWFAYSEESRKLYNKAIINNIIKIKAAELLITLAFILMLCLFTYMIISGLMSASIIIAVTGALDTFINVFTWNLSDNIMSFARSREFLNDLTAFFALDEVDESSDAMKNGFEKLEFRNVSFKYPGTERYILKDFSIELNKSRHYAIVGSNGSGKTTIIKLITGLYREYEGEILLNGKDIKKYSQDELNDVFSVVFQDFARYNVSFSENIKLDNKNDDRKLYEDVKIKLGLDKVVEALPKKDETYLGKAHNEGVDISGGEWQKIAIARSLYNCCPFRILDEPTAALDPSAESKVYSMFQNICKNDTTLVITHRLAAAKFSDEIIVISDGATAEIGNHDELMTAKGIYYKMFMTQRRCFE